MASNKRERGGALALGGLRFININNNQMEDGVDVKGCVGEEAWLGWNVWGGRLPVIWGGILIDKNNREMGGPFALDGRRLDTTTNQKLALTMEGILKRRGNQGGTFGGVLSLHLERRINKEKK